MIGAGSLEIGAGRPISRPSAGRTGLPPYCGPPAASRPAATCSLGAAGRGPVIKLPPACGPGDGGFAPPAQNRPLGRPGPAVPRWTRVTSRALLTGAPPASARSALDAPTGPRGFAWALRFRLHPTATAARCGSGSRCAWWPSACREARFRVHRYILGIISGSAWARLQEAGHRCRNDGFPTGSAPFRASSNAFRCGRALEVLREPPSFQWFGL